MGDFIKTSTYDATQNEDGSWTVKSDKTGKEATIPHEQFMQEYKLTPAKKGTPYSEGKAAYVRAKKGQAKPAAKAAKEKKAK
jgi:hypothetical protein